MGIVFFCQSCGARFEVDPRAAGKKGRCKQCGQMMTVPQAEQLAPMASIPALAEAGARAAGASPGVPRAGATPGAGDTRPPAASWLKQAISEVKLAPITVDRMRISLRGKRSPVEDEDSKPYQLAKPDRREARAAAGSGPAGAVTRAWRGQLGRLQKLFRWINQTAYLVSTPFLMLILLGDVIQNRSMALVGATVVVLLNIGRLGAGAVNLALVPLRDGFDWKKMKKPAQRIIEPVVTIGLVIVAFTFLPGLSSGKPAKGGVGSRLRASAAGLKSEMRGKVKGAADSLGDVDLQKLGAQAQDQLQGLGERARAIDLKKLGAEARERLERDQRETPPDSQATKPRIGGRVRSGIEALEKRTAEEIQKSDRLGKGEQEP
jgi:hypothetical protein